MCMSTPGASSVGSSKYIKESRTAYQKIVASLNIKNYKLQTPNNKQFPNSKFLKIFPTPFCMVGENKMVIQVGEGTFQRLFAVHRRITLYRAGRAEKEIKPGFVFSCRIDWPWRDCRNPAYHTSAAVCCG